MEVLVCVVLPLGAWPPRGLKSIESVLVEGGEVLAILLEDGEKRWRVG